MKNLWHQDNRSSVIWRSYWRFTWIIEFEWSPTAISKTKTCSNMNWMKLINFETPDTTIGCRHCHMKQVSNLTISTTAILKTTRNNTTYHLYSIQLRIFENCKTCCCCLKILIFWIISCWSLAGSSKTIGIEPTYI